MFIELFKLIVNIRPEFNSSKVAKHYNKTDEREGVTDLNSVCGCTLKCVYSEEHHSDISKINDRFHFTFDMTFYWAR